jgi:DNA invertase Pin-like site-specific DNA recombinase
MQRYRRVLGYARVSSAEQALGTSLRDQQEAIRAFAAARGIADVRMYVEAESAIHEKIERREQVHALLRDVRAGDVVVCDKLDRWSRDIVFTHSSVRQVLAAGAGFFSVAENLDASTADGDFQLGIRAVLAKEEHRRIRIRTVGTRKLLRERGLYVEGKPPLGYRRARPKGHKGADKNVLAVVPEEAATVAEIFRRYVGGESMRSVAGALGLKLDRVKDALHRRVYVGEVQTGQGEWIRGQHEAIVDAKTFARAQERIAQRRLGGPRPRSAPSETSTWILRDVARCAHCAAKMAAAYAGPRDARRYYYRCSKRCQSRGTRATNGSFVPVAEVEEQVGALVLARLEELRHDIARGAEPDSAPRLVDFDAKRRALALRRDRILVEFEYGHIDREQLRAKLAKLDAERLRVDADEQEAATTSVLASADVRRALLREITAVRIAWSHATESERRELVGLLASSVRLAKGRAPVPVWRTAEELAADVC